MDMDINGGDIAATSAGMAILGMVVGRVASVFSFGKILGNYEEKFGAMNQTILEHEEKVERLREWVVSSVETVRRTHDDDMKELRSFFSTSSGGQKFMTFIDHDMVCDRNSRMTLKAIHDLTEAIKDNTAKVNLMGEQFHAVTTDVAILKDRARAFDSTDTSTGRRSGD